jgi:hypothetical protein
MAYNPIPQREHPPSPDIGPSPVLNGSSARPLSMERDELDGGMPVDGITGAADPTLSRLSSLIPSITSTRSSYDMVEDDDYEEPQVAPLNVSRHENENQLTPTRVRDPQRPSHSSSPQRTVPYRTASISRDTPLRHPAPDLQSLQGAYIKNVERLEESAERLSVTSSLEEELQKMKLEPARQSSAPISRVSPAPRATRQFSSGSATNSIIDLHTAARSGGYSPSGYITSPLESAFSGSWSQPSAQGRPTSKGSRLASGQIEPTQKHTPLDSGALTLPSVLVQPESPENAYPGAGPDHPARSEQDQRHQQEEENAQDRPRTSASNDTYRQITDLFGDFDGVHFTPLTQLSLSSQAPRGRQVPLSQPPLASDPKSFREPQPGERMVYYPAPVPMMLNLPQKLSKEPAGRRERRRLQGISEIPDEMRKSAAWLQGESTDQPGSKRNTQALAGLPPQLRASAFFDQPATTQHVAVKEASAVATLDSILDASAHAPVSAFTDHPIVGNVGKEVYGKAKLQRKSETVEKAEKKKRNTPLHNMLRTSTGLTSGTRRPFDEMSNTSQGRIASRESKAFEGEEDAADAAGEFTPLRTSDDLARAAEQSISPEDDELLDDEDQDKEGEEEEEDDQDDHDMGYIGPPTTLLAELQMRKAQQKQRNRTAATAFPNGMHATLLELDAIAQLQQKSRKQKHVILAWEDHELADRQNFDDEDVPLAMLVPQAQNDVNRPIGLMERRDIEDNEPLSRRRARIRGEPFRPYGLASAVQNDASSLRTLEKPGLEEEGVDEQEGETLAQRLKRLKAQKEQLPHVATDFAAEISSQLGLKIESAVAPSGIPDAEETLGQRRKRLQQEALNKKQDVGGGNSQELPNPVKPKPSAPNMPQNDRILDSQAVTPHLGTQDEDVPLSQLRNKLAVQGMAPMQIPYNNTMPYVNGAFNYGAPMMYSPTMVQPYYGVNVGPLYTQDPMMGPPLDPKQRIDSWRQGVVR